MDQYGLLERTCKTGERFMSLLRDAFSEHVHVGEIRGRGLFVGIELVQDVATRAGFENRNGLPGELMKAAMEQGLIVYPGGIQVEQRMVPHVMLAPPMIVEERHLHECIDKLTATINSVL
jgi:adenosylmethionine-8-amino-7-oxononanoate aminotransferase